MSSSAGLSQLASVTPPTNPATTWEYSNANYQILGRVIEVVSGQDYQAYMADNILEPVGMNHSFVADGKIHESMATGHTTVVRHQATLVREPDRRVARPRKAALSPAPTTWRATWG